MNKRQKNVLKHCLVSLINYKVIFAISAIKEINLFTNSYHALAALSGKSGHFLYNFLINFLRY